MVSVGGSRHLSVGSEDSGDHLEKASGSRHVTVGGEMQVKVGGSMRLTVEETQDLVIRGNKAERVCGESASLVVDGDVLSRTVGFHQHRIGSSAHVVVRQEAILHATYVHVLADRIYVSGSELLQLRGGAGGAFITLDDSGVVIKGPAVDINCEQTTPRTPDPPPLQDPVVATEAAPSDPAGADSAESGRKSSPD